MSTQIEDIPSMPSFMADEQQQKIRLIVVDDQRLFRESIAGILNAESRFEVVGLGSNGREALELAHQLQPDVVLMDVKMPQMDGIEAVRQIKAVAPTMRVILLTTFVADEYIMAGLAAGANGYILKDTSTVGLISAICAVYAGEQVTAPGVTTRMMHLLHHRPTNGAQHHDGLTARELETLVLVARGMIAKEIAHTLHISEKTVRNHISNIYRKIGAYDRSQVVIYAMKKGLVDVNEL